MPLICRSRTSRKVHPRAYGADTKFLKRIPVISKPFFCLGLPQQNQYASFWPGIFLRITLFGQYWPEMIHIWVIAVWRTHSRVYGADH